MRKVELLAVTREWEESALRSKARFSRKRKEQLFYSRRAQDIRRRTSPQDITLILVGQGDGGVLPIKGCLPAPQKKMAFEMSKAFPLCYTYEELVRALLRGEQHRVEVHQAGAGHQRAVAAVAVR